MKTDEEVLDKWKKLVNYSSDNIGETPDELKLYVSQTLEEWEQKCFEWVKEGKINDDVLFPKNLIPQVRHSLGNPDIELDVEIDGRLCLVVNNGAIYSYSGKVGIPYKQERDCYCMTGIHLPDIYVVIDDQWKHISDCDFWKWW